MGELGWRWWGLHGVWDWVWEWVWVLGVGRGCDKQL